MTARPDRPIAALSVDLDSVRTHLDGYRIHADGPDRLVDVAVDRLLGLFRDRSVRATFFVVARDVAPSPQWLGSIRAEGHEIASHSVDHPMGFSRLPGERLRRELAESRLMVEERAGAPVLGFRCPNWDVSARVLALARRAGYRYDASLLPTPLLIPARLLLAAKSGSPSSLVQQPLWPTSLRRLPHVVSTRAGSIAEVPVSVTPWARWPIYHTLRYRTSDDRFASLLDGFVRRREPLSYPLHAIDVAGVEEDALDPRLARHPGAELPLAAKIDLMGRTLDLITERFVSRPVGELVKSTGQSG